MAQEKVLIFLGEIAGELQWGLAHSRESLNRDELHSPLSGRKKRFFRDYFKSLFYADTTAIRSATRRIAIV
ncbi:hypothetical protein SAMN05216417_12113 [Nitrosospira multiformis]|uniref:Uncharacterized protein n=1 Tax=Nitrosospira multiformis TaxID=1231 RepID=A0A1I7IKX9_9PROT|nr:hypothetical protein SAMN05216417_12113 [Nitrosospira multiformis]